jgi:hypothetical protein
MDYSWWLLTASITTFGECRNARFLSLNGVDWSRFSNGRRLSDQTGTNANGTRSTIPNANGSLSTIRISTKLWTASTKLSAAGQKDQVLQTSQASKALLLTLLELYFN